MLLYSLLAESGDGKGLPYLVPTRVVAVVDGSVSSLTFAESFRRQTLWCLWVERVCGEQLRKGFRSLLGTQ